MKSITLCTVLVCCLSLCGFSQTGFFVKNSDIEKWYIEDPSKEEEIKKVLKNKEFKESTRGRLSVEEVAALFHFVDMDHNGTLDLLFHGKIFNVYHTFVFYKKDDTYSTLIGEKGSIAYSNQPNGDNCLELAIWKEGCCGDFTNSYTQYVCLTNSDNTYFERISKSLLFRRTAFPSKRLERPVSFKTNTIANLRTESVVDDQKEIGGKDKWKGNTVAIYPANAKGVVYAEAQDGNNETWYFVRMNNESDIILQENRFVTNNVKIEDIKGFFSYGWIKSSDITVDGK